MSLARRPGRLYASILSIALIAGLLFVNPAAAEPPQSAPTNSLDGPWWVDWLEVFDLNNNKIDDLVERNAHALVASGNSSKTVPVLLTFESSLPNRKSLVDSLAAQNPYFFETQPVADLDVPAANIRRLASIPGLAAVEYDMKVRPVLDVSAPATQANRGSGANTFYNGSTAEDLGYTGDGMVIAVLDTGVQDVHEAFPGKFVDGAYVAAPRSVDCVNPPDGDGHGTHVASTALGQFSGSRTLNGTAKAARLVDIKISIDAGATSATIGGIARGFDFVKRYNDALAAGSSLCGAGDDHIDVATLSFGSTGRGGPNAGTDEPFIDALVNSGVAVTIAVGNCGPGGGPPGCTFTDTDNGISSPGNATGAIGVASFDDRGTVDRAGDIISDFSSRGPNNSSGDATAGGATSASNLQDRYRKPEIAAPGTSITAAGPAPFTLNTLSGTSMATPHVAGISALLLEAGEDAKAQTGRNLMMSTGNGYSATGAYLPGAYPVRDAIIHAPDHKATGAEAKWTGPNSAGLLWNNAWGYGQVNAFGALCWAWANVLAPAGATPPGPVASRCTLDPDPTSTPTSTPTDTTSPSSSPSPTATSNPTAGTTYYFHSLTGDNTLDQTEEDGATYDTTFPTFPPDQWSKAQDLPGFQNAGAIEVVDPTWRGSIQERATSVSVNFWGDQIPDPDAFGMVHYTVRVLPAGQTSYLELLPPIEQEAEPGLTNIKHTFTEMRTSSTAPATALDLPAGPLTFTIRGTFTVDDAYTELRFDSTNFPASFTTNGGPQVEPSPTPTEPAALGTTLEFTGGDGGAYSDEATIAARLTDENGNAIEGAELAFEMTGADSVERWTATTDADGIGSATRTLTGAPGTYNLTVSYGGQADFYEPSGNQQFFFIDKDQTVTTLDVTGKGKIRKLTASLTEDDGPSLGGREIVFFANGTEIGRATTNDQGVAVLQAPQGYRGDQFLFEARFNGTENYRESSDAEQT